MILSWNQHHDNSQWFLETIEKDVAGVINLYEGGYWPGVCIPLEIDEDGQERDFRKSPKPFDHLSDAKKWVADHATYTAHGKTVHMPTIRDNSIPGLVEVDISLKDLSKGILIDLLCGQSPPLHMPNHMAPHVKRIYRSYWGWEIDSLMTISKEAIISMYKNCRAVNNLAPLSYIGRKTINSMDIEGIVVRVIPSSGTAILGEVIKAIHEIRHPSVSINLTVDGLTYNDIVQSAFRLAQINPGFEQRPQGRWMKINYAGVDFSIQEVRHAARLMIAEELRAYFLFIE